MKVANIKQWKTTTIGLLIIIASIVSVFLKSVTWADASFGIGIGVVLMFSPDAILSKFDKFVK